jgi:hypothetical protein
MFVSPEKGKDNLVYSKENPKPLTSNNATVRPTPIVVRLSWLNCSNFRFRKVTEAETMSEVKSRNWDTGWQLSSITVNCKLHLISRLCNISKRCRRSVKCNFFLCWSIEWQIRKAGDKTLLHFTFPPLFIHSQHETSERHSTVCYLC